MFKFFILLVSFLVVHSAAAQNVTATKSYVDKRDSAKRDKTDLQVYGYGWDYSAVSNVVPGVYLIDDEKKIDPGHPFVPLYQWVGGMWDEVGYGDVGGSGYRITTAVSTHRALVGLVVTNGVLSATGETLATSSTIAPVVTNAVRGVLGTVYDEKLGITWKQVMYDGNLYYVAVTNGILEAAQ
jgi:hypothetical protein